MTPAAAAAAAAFVLSVTRWAKDALSIAMDAGLSFTIAILAPSLSTAHSSFVSSCSGLWL